MTEPAVGASVCASGSQVWNGNIGTLIAKAKKKPQKSQFCKLQREHGVRRRSESSADIESVRVEVNRQDRKQHQHRTCQRVQEEFDRRIEPPLAAPDADQEIHRHEHHFPENVEEHEIERHENAEHARLQQQEAGCNIPSRVSGSPTTKRESRWRRAPWSACTIRKLMPSMPRR